MIKSFTIQDWKSFERAELPIAPLTLLVGANASGKSNAIEAVRCISWLAEGRRLSELMTTFQEADQQIRGSVDTLGHLGSTAFMLGCQTDDSDWNTYLIAIAANDDGFRVLHETLSGPASEQALFETAGRGPSSSHEILVAYNTLSGTGSRSMIPATDDQSVLSQLTTPARFASSDAKGQAIITRTVQEFRTALSNTLFLDPNPRRMRQYGFEFERTLKGDGANLSSVLFDLCRRDVKQRILDFVRALPEQEFVDLSFVHTQRREVMLELTESFAGRKAKWDASVLSDGTLRVLAVAAALFSAPEGSLVVIEEIDNGVHPSRAGMLLQNIERVANERGLRVLLTTHNPALVDTLPADATPNIVYCYRDPVEGDSRLVRLEDLPNYPELVARGPLGQLMTRGILERMVKQQPSSEERKRAATEWLNALDEQARSA